MPETDRSIHFGTHIWTAGPELPPNGVTSDHLLGGRVAYMQPRDGFRAAIDPVLLAAAIPARAGDRVLEGGTGAGAALLCLAARVADISGIGIDRDPALLRLARSNAAANARSGLLFVAGDITASPIGGEFDHAFANPPYHAASGTKSPSRLREAAKRSSPDQLSVWVAALSRPLRHRGTLTMILPPRLLEAALSAMQACKVPAECVFPIWPVQGQPARLMLVQGRRHGRSPLVLAYGLALHTETGAFRPEAELVLRAGGALRLTGG
jgi:tRNA1Val (adenine37-N6)-methyltransferase